ncbi:Signal transduction histidine kinase [Saccharopolyspora antimicrobica]|uniref:histidine kinase n=1 Tax=Saccharopolyspora antimicrobica TaxID=455193 RepID=A0A1I5C8Y1_9PSEU|nr:signal transduction histidine kinase [Saccharopolyspora antimicrobica]SFN83417.1 Signal transduction histidine kinase [Saccharopolyspora antimicrobica]
MVALSPLAERLGSAVSGAVEQVRATPRRLLVRDAVLASLVLAVGLVPVPVLLLPTGHIGWVIALACWTALLVPACWRWPVATLLATAPVFAGPNFWAAAVLPVITFAAARHIAPARRLWLAVLATAVADFALMLAFDLSSAGGFGEVVAAYAVSAMLLLVLPAAVGAILGHRRPRVRLLQERNEYLERAQLLTAAKARVEERGHIAGEMHDMLGHRLSLISIHAGALELSAAENAPELSGQAELLRTTASSALSELREILGVLRGAEESDLGPDDRIGTRPDVEDLVAESRAAGIDVDLRWTGADLDSADPRTRRAVHRVVREGLTNVHKHASSARTGVEIGVETDRVHVRVVNGPAQAGGRRLPGTRSGLVGLDERIALLDGIFHSGPTPEGGFLVAAAIPTHPAGTDRPEPSVLPGQLPPEPLAAEALTWPRVLGAGCLGLLAALPVITGLAMLIVALMIS